MNNPDNDRLITVTQLTTAIELTKELYRVNLCVLDNPASIEHFVKQYHFHRCQTAITVEHIKELIADYPSDTLYITDSLMINYIIFHLNGLPVIVGPFCSLLLSSHDVRTILKRNRVEDLTVQDFFSYYNSYPSITETNALHLIESLQTVVCNRTDTPKIRKITSLSMTHTEYDSYPMRRANNSELLEKRYSFKQRFMLNIEKGNARSAILDLHNMQADVQYLKRIGTTLENEKIGAAITRTTVRIAALKAGLPIIIIDQLSSNNTIAIKNASTVDEILKAKEQMIRDFCSAILDCKNEKYSALVQSIIYFIEHRYYTDINLDELSSELDLSKNYLISSFRKETGITPIAYLRKVRLKQATVLLYGTNYSIQEISESVGIPDANYFIKLFKKEYGVTPYAYRKRLT